MLRRSPAARGAVAALALLLACSVPQPAQAAYELVKAYEGSSFFDGWQFYGHYDNLTNGDVDYVTASGGKDLAYINDAGNAIIKVDNTTSLVYPNKRRIFPRLHHFQIRVTDAKNRPQYPIGTLIIHDVLHLPYGCSVWPSLWTSAPNWPQGGEIDILEGVNLQQENRMALHTSPGCTASSSSTSAAFTGELTYSNCDAYANANSGCGVTEENTAPSYGADFGARGGGIWATELGKDGIRIWFFPRSAVPATLLTSNSSSPPDISTFPTPSAFYPSSSCNTPDFFAPQHLVITLTLCGDWAGNTAVLAQTGCPLKSGSPTCYDSYVLECLLQLRRRLL
ncbi:hypothetical protein JCM10207_001421 [Rhodosporidiobolus poonsookiae]